MNGATPSDIAHIIDLAIAPVFLIAGIGALLNVLTARLGRVVDRGRMLETVLATQPGGVVRERAAGELKAIGKRMTRINVAITLATLAMLLVCLVIVFLFAGELLAVNLGTYVAALFIATMASLIAALCFFLGEIGLAIRTLKLGVEELKKP